MSLIDNLNFFIRSIIKELYELRFFFRTSKKNCNILNTLKKDGIVVIPNFVSENFCDSSIKALEQDLTNPSVKRWSDDIEADTRIFGYEKLSMNALKFLNNQYINNISSSYLGYETSAKFILAGRIENKKNNLGSGGGWHRDDAVIKQFKAIIYLSDVDNKHGPFQYILGSHKLISRLKLFINGHKFYQSRYTENSFVNSNKIFSVKGGKGDLILVDTKGIHRGKPIEEGLRYALTLYSWRKKIPNHINTLLN